MNIIDERGRLFGKINVIDFLVVLFFICLVPMFYHSYKIIYDKPKQETIKQEKPKQEEPKKEFIEIKMDCLFIKLKPKIAKIISVGDKELDKNGEPIGEVFSIRGISPYVHEFEMGVGENFAKKDSVLKQALVNLKIKAEVRQKKLYYKDKQILEGTASEFTTNKYQTEIVWLHGKGIKPILKESDEKLGALEKRFDEKLGALEKRFDRIKKAK